MNAWTSVLAASVLSDRTNGRNCLSWKNPNRQSAVTWADIVNSASRMTPRSRADSATLMVVDTWQHGNVTNVDAANLLTWIYASLKSTFSGIQSRRWQCRSIFICLAVVASQICKITQNSEKIRTYTSSKSSKVINLGANRKQISICVRLLGEAPGPPPQLHR